MFADGRALFGIPFAGNVTSNLAYAIVDALGLAFVWGRRGRSLFT